MSGKYTSNLISYLSLLQETRSTLQFPSSFLTSFDGESVYSSAHHCPSHVVLSQTYLRFLLTFVQREHNETVSKLSFVLALTECIMELASSRSSPLTETLTESLDQRQNNGRYPQQAWNFLQTCIQVS